MALEPLNLTEPVPVTKTKLLRWEPLIDIDKKRAEKKVAKLSKEMKKLLKKGKTTKSECINKINEYKIQLGLEPPTE